MRAMREQLTIKTAVLTAAPVSSHPSRRLGTSVSTAGSVRRRPAKRVVWGWSGNPTSQAFHTLVVRRTLAGWIGFS
jgi:hypothetical protein